MVSQRGFSLLEILVAFSILALSLGILMQIFSGSLRNADVALEQAQAVVMAQTLLAPAGVAATLTQSETTGTVANRFRWQLRVSPMAQEARAGEAGAATTPLLLDLWEISARVAWGGEAGQPERALVLTTLRVQPAAKK